MKFEKKIDGAHSQPGHLDLDSFYADRVKNPTSRAKKLLKKRSSLRDAFILKEIIQRPYDF